MAVPTRSSSHPNARAWGAVLVGLLAVAAVPAGVALTHYRNIELLKAGWAAVPGLVLGIASLAVARAARRRTERTIGRVGGRSVTRLGRYLGALGIYLALAAALSVGVYELLNKLSG
jgi:cob(I)alamin adenosyltransferase